MNNCGKNCPECNQDIGIWAIFKAPWPSKIICKNCSALLTYNSIDWPMIIAFAFIYIGLLIFILSGDNLLSNSHVVFHALFAAILWSPFELAMAFILRKFHMLVLKNS